MHQSSLWLVSFWGKMGERKKVTFMESLLHGRLEGVLFFNPWVSLVQLILSSFYRRNWGFRTHPKPHRRWQCRDLNPVLNACPRFFSAISASYLPAAHLFSSKDTAPGPSLAQNAPEMLSVALTFSFLHLGPKLGKESISQNRGQKGGSEVWLLRFLPV